MPKVTVQQVCDTYPGKKVTVNTKGSPDTTPWLVTVTEIQEALKSGAFTHARSLVDPSGNDTGRVRVAVSGKAGKPFTSSTFQFGAPQKRDEVRPVFSGDGDEIPVVSSVSDQAKGRDQSAAKGRSRK